MFRILYYPFCLIFSISAILLSCSSPNDTGAQATSNTVVPPASWVDERVSQAEQRLQASAAGRQVWQAIEAHGGLDRWYSNGPLQFHFNYQPLDGNTPRNTIQVANQWSSQTRHYLAGDTAVQFGWDGQQAWATDTASIPFDARFWALTPYYFVGIPFVLADDGVNFEVWGEDTYKGQAYDLVKVTFDENIGDAPDDYYVLYLRQDNHQLGVIRYIVSYPGYFPEGGHAPEKFMALQGLQTVEGITLPTGYKTYWWKEDQPGEHITDITVSDVDFLPELSEAYFAPPQEADLITAVGG